MKNKGGLGDSKIIMGYTKKENKTILDVTIISKLFFVA